MEFSTDAASESDALRIGRARLAEIEAGRETPDAHRTRVAELWDDLCRDYRVNERRLENLAKAWRWLEPVFGRDRAVDVTTPRLRRYVEERLAGGAARATVRQELALLHRAMVLGHEAGRVARLPAFPTIRVQNTRTGFIEREALARLVAELPAELRIIAVLGAWLGWRRGELLGLEWRQVSLATGEVRLDPGTTKNGDGRAAFLPPESLEELRAWRAETDRVERERGMIVRWVCHRGGEPIRGGYDAWRSACRRAGVPGLLLHDLRRTAARAYLRSGVPEHVVMRVLGHRTTSMLHRYAIVSERELREAAGRVTMPSSGEADRGAQVVEIGR